MCAKKNTLKEKFDLSISFAGEDREVAENIAKILDASGYSIFYDDFMKSELWGSELPVKLGEIYGSQSRFCLMIISKAYVRKMWTNHERKYAIQKMLESHTDYILPLKIEDVIVPGLPTTIAYITLASDSINDVCKLVIQKLGDPKIHKEVSIHSSDVKIVKDVISLCYTRAIFTKMDSEIRLDAMFESIGSSISQLQRRIIKIKSQFIQRIILEIVSKLDEIERYRNSVEDIQVYSINTKPAIRKQIDLLKVEVINRLHTLRREANISVQLPTTLIFDHFFSLDDANKRPQ